MEFRSSTCGKKKTNQNKEPNPKKPQKTLPKQKL